MKFELIDLLRCPKSGQRFLLDAEASQDEILSGSLVTVDQKYRYPIRNGIPRFVPESNYADNFGMQWNHFAKTQMDSYSGQPITENRFFEATAWSKEDLKGQWVLDVGCGSGRFAEVALKAGANVVALDYSSAVDACYFNLKAFPNLHVVQGDIYDLPFQTESFTFVYSLGVLQHTPDVKKAFEALPPMVKSGGRLCVDYYEKSLKSILFPKYWLRPITKRMPQTTLFSFLQKAVPVLLAVSRFLGKVPGIGHLLKRLVPVANFYGLLSLDEKQQREWSLLDTFDWLAPKYDQPQTATTVRRWMEEANMKEIKVIKAGHLVANGRK